MPIVANYHRGSHTGSAKGVCFVAMPTYRSPKPLTKRGLLAKERADAQKVLKLHIIAERRARAQGMDKQAFIAEIVKGNFRPITAEDIAAEPDVVASTEQIDAPLLAEPTESVAPAEPLEPVAE